MIAAADACMIARQQPVILALLLVAASCAVTIFVDLSQFAEGNRR